MKLPLPIRNTLRNSKLIRSLYFDFHLADIPVCLGIGSFGKELISALNEFLTEDERSNSELVQTITKDIKSCYYHYKFTPQEYFLFELRTKNNTERQKYLSDHMIMKSVADKSGRKIHDTELNDKFNFYLINKPFFKRNAVLFDPLMSFEKFRTFALSSGKFIAKPNTAALGTGVKIYNIKNDRDIETAFNQLKKLDADFILEDIIIQSQEMAVWNSSSVNSIRINSFLNNGKFNIAFPFIRTGRKGSIVDNGGQGGIFASINKNTGQICSVGMDEKGKSYQHHPDSNITYKGWQVPRWNELLQLAEQVHRNMPKHRYVSWDFALTDDGWVLIEGNWGEFVCQQMTYEKGLKNDFISLLNIN